MNNVCHLRSGSKGVVGTALSSDLELLTDS